jgi:hypothetical protein
MNDIIKSATKLVLLYLMFILGALSVFAGVWGIIKGTLEPKEIITYFGSAVTFLLGYYFNSKGDTSQPFGGK